MDTESGNLRRHLASFSMLRSKIFQIEENLSKGITAENATENIDAGDYEEDFPSLGGGPGAAPVVKGNWEEKYKE